MTEYDEPPTYQDLLKILSLLLAAIFASCMYLLMALENADLSLIMAAASIYLLSTYYAFKTDGLNRHIHSLYADTEGLE